MRWRVDMWVLSPQSVRVRFCIEAESRVQLMKLIWTEPEGFRLDHSKPYQIYQCSGCDICKE
jgi:hypothetical protein